MMQMVCNVLNKTIGKWMYKRRLRKMTSVKHSMKPGRNWSFLETSAEDIDLSGYNPLAHYVEKRDAIRKTMWAD